MQKKASDKPVRRGENITIDGKRGHGRPKKTSVEQIRKDLGDVYLSEDLTWDMSS